MDTDDERLTKDLPLDLESMTELSSIPAVTMGRDSLF